MGFFLAPARKLAAEEDAHMNERLLTVKEAAAFLRCAPSTVYDRAAAGQLPVVKLWESRRKSALRFTLESLKDHVERNTVVPAPARKK